MDGRIMRMGRSRLPDGRETEAFLLRNGAVEVAIDLYGARLTTCRVHGVSVVLGHGAVGDYVDERGCLGATIGRYANRIADGRFTLDGVSCSIPPNDGPNALHGGPVGFDRAVWRLAALGATPETGLMLAHRSPDGDQGFPGALDVTLRFALSADGALGMAYAARTDRPTVLNLTNHAYFNLDGEGSGAVLDHELAIEADAFTPVDAALIPTGELRLVAGTAFDFRNPVAIGARIGAAEEQLRIAGGYDHNFVLHETPGLRLAARARGRRTGITLEVLTTEPGLQFYSGNFLGETQRARAGGPLFPRAGFCLETQHFPDSPNQPRFPSAVLRPGALFSSTTIYRFGR